MGRKFGYMMLLVALATPAIAASKPATISGIVRNSAGAPQMGAVVEVFEHATQAITVFTDARGRYTATGLRPGIYNVKVSAPAFLPSLRENVSLKEGAAILLNVTLNTLFEAVQLLPARRPASDDDDWRWTLRSAANRPILRVVDGSPILVQGRSDDPILKARLAFVAGSPSDGFGSTGEMSTQFNVERSLFTAGTLSIKGNVGYGAGPQTGMIRASYRHRMDDGSIPEFSVTMRRFATPESVIRNGALQALSLRMADTFALADFVDLNVGTEYQTIQFTRHLSAVKPFGSINVHLTPDTMVEYRYATALPNTRRFMGFDSAPADLSEVGPRISLAEASTALERARHQEISVSHRAKWTNVQIAAYTDHIANTALTGAGEPLDSYGELLPDIYSGTFTYNGGTLETKGIRAVVQQKLPGNLTGTLNYSYGGVLDLAGSNMNWSAVRACVRPEWRHALGARLSGTAPGTHTKWIASYRWTNRNSLTPVDAYDASPGQMDPYLNLFMRQPLPSASFLPGKMEALVDLRNLLAQGYVPVFGPDGQTLYLVQSARAVRGGLAFVF